MSPIEAALLVALMVLPFHLFIQYYLSRLENPRHIRASGVVVEAECAFARHGELIGEYCGHAIYADVEFMGMVYRFDRIAPRSYRHNVVARELYLDPGLVYITD